MVGELGLEEAEQQGNITQIEGWVGVFCVQHGTVPSGRTHSPAADHLLCKCKQLHHRIALMHHRRSGGVGWLRRGLQIKA